MRNTLVAAATVLVVSGAYAQPKEGDVTVSFTPLTSFYQYENDEARRELPEELTSFFDDTDLRGDEDDIVNLNIGIGYYVTPKLHIGVTYTDGIELGFLDDLDGIIAAVLLPSSDPDFRFDADLNMLAVDARYHAIDISDSVNFYIVGGAVFNRVTANVDRVDGSQRIPEISASDNEIGAKLGFGLQWNMSENWVMNLGYQHFTFMSIDNTALALECRW